MFRNLENVHKKKQNFLLYFKKRRTKAPLPPKKTVHFSPQFVYQSWGEEGRQYTGTVQKEWKGTSFSDGDFGHCWGVVWLLTQRVESFSSSQLWRRLQGFKLNGNQTENDRYWQKNNFLLFAKCLKMYSFFSFLHLKYEKSAKMTPKIFFLKNINMGIKNAEFHADFKFVDADLNKRP